MLHNTIYGVAKLRAGPINEEKRLAAVEYELSLQYQFKFSFRQMKFST